MTLTSIFRPLAAALAIVIAVPAAADEYIDQANALYSSIRQAKRSDLILLPVVAKMDRPPAAASDPNKAMLLPTGSAGWDAAEAWANAAPQRAVLAALDQVTKNEDPIDAMAFGQPYGADAMATGPEGIELVRAGLYTDLGDPPMLAGAKFLYLSGLEQVACLVHVEATRLAAEGKPAEAISALIDWLFFARQIADRQYFTECRWGVRMMIDAFERIRDVAYTDFRYGKRELTPSDILAVLERIRAENGFLRLERLMFPMADRLAAEQVVAKTFTPRGGPNATFGQTLARLAATQRPLRLFAEAARWDQAAAAHANWFDTTEQLGRVFSDMSTRWPLDAFDPRNDITSDFEKMNKARFAVLTATIPDATVLLNDRQVLATQAVGTRCALGLTAFYYLNKNFPPDIASIRPRLVKVIEADPFNPNRANGKQPPLEYFVPIRDQRTGPRDTPEPHRINVNARGAANFQVRVGDDQFVLYSVGPNKVKEWAENVYGEPAKGAIGDMLLWPPVTSLLRQRLTETGVLK